MDGNRKLYNLEIFELLTTSRRNEWIRSGKREVIGPITKAEAEMIILEQSVIRGHISYEMVLISGHDL